MRYHSDTQRTEVTIADLPQIVAASRVVQLYAAEKLSVKALRFIVCDLLPPPKKHVLAYLGIPLVAGQEPDEHPGELPRKAGVDVSTAKHVIFPRSAIDIQG